jgi:hypothetical protein
MSRFEPWRLQELALLIDDLVIILRSGKNPEWASVFAHFDQELKLLGQAKTGYRNALSRLIRSILPCLAKESSLSRLELAGKDAEESRVLNQRFIHLQARLRKALDDIQERLIEFVN